ncbi:MAG: mechanosensitive ion channel family protein [Deltaproteobacteria bacterium]|nr:mechanosensitive ion channel family protein [Deltaproteobacteria bacterium]
MIEWDFWHWQLFQNTLSRWALAFAIALCICVSLFVIKSVLTRRLKIAAQRTITELDDFAVELIEYTRKFFIIAVSIYIGSLYLELSPNVEKLLRNALILLGLVQTALWGNQIIDFLIKQKFKKARAFGKYDPTWMSVAPTLKFIGRLVLYSVLILLALENLGVDVTTLVAGLGVGGLAVALAVQNILGDLFSSLSIVLDKPFVIGDVIAVDNFVGTVEQIGLKTTRLRSISGEELIISNSNLLASRIQNFKRMSERRIQFTIGVVYSTPFEKLNRISEMIRRVIEKQKDVRFDRAHFKTYGDSALQFEVSYFVLSPDLVTYLDIHQDINLDLFQAFAREKIEFAFPTRTLYVQNLESAERAG